MRRLPLLALLVALAAPAAAQTPDPTPPWTYDPVGVGNVRAYQVVGVVTPEPFFRTDSPAALDSLGQRWTVRRTHRYRRVGDEGYGWARTEERRLVRYDTAAANVLTVGRDGQAVPLYPCRLDLPLPGGECDGGSYSVRLDETVSVGGLSFQAAVRSFDGAVPGPHLAADVGLVHQGWEPSGSNELVYAVVGGDTLGVLPGEFPRVESDPTPPWLYYPLAVGNEWQYAYTGPDWHYTRRRITGTERVGVHTYFVEERSRARLDESEWSVVDEVRLRFDTLSAHVVTPDGGTLAPCPFDEPLNASVFEDAALCLNDGPVDVWAAFGSGPGSDRQESGLVVTSTSFKGFAYLGIADGASPGTYAAGVGYLPDTEGAWSPIGTAGLIYARVRQEDGGVLEIGERYAVAGEDGPEAGALALSLGPNPTAGPLAVAFEMATPAEVTAEALDALGRRVWRWEGALGGGRQRLGLDAAAWAPGLYVVRVTAGGRTASARFVRR